ncbi:DUF72 domain-containing protein [Leifsonia bigeumensis]|uniref:DUF72 domain-containing protein n=1 Tax=Leifsonella bigeumensis TaxID=433643 RepID=A0ABP7FDL1_9MICO
MGSDRARVRIGTCGWDKAAWRGDFYPPRLPAHERLGFASRNLATLEINTTFHGLKKPEDFLGWYADTPADFVFSVKGHRGVTHDNPLGAAERTVAAFFASGVPLLQEKLGPILWQVSEHLRFNADAVTAFLTTLPHSVDEVRSLIAEAGIGVDPRILDLPDAPLRHAFEARHPSFGDPAFVDLLRHHNVAAVITNTPEWPELREVTSDFSYLRFHGDLRRFPRGYDDETLASWAELIEGRRTRSSGSDEGLEVFAYFDNPENGGAGSPFTARKLQQLVDGAQAVAPLPIQPLLF